MEANYKVNPSEINDLISYSNEPLVLKNYIKCDLINWKLEDWQRVLDQTTLEFRCGLNKFTKDPQWERNCSIKKGTFEEFKKFCESEESGTNWMYFDYKYLNQWLTDKETIRKNIKWDAFGFGDMGADDATIWIGSKNAHTPCHIDSYGVNIVIQIFGRKQWVLFPPDMDLKPSRIPYEESSIYSRINFFSPSKSSLEDIETARLVELNPGDVLFVPHKWWHYVENLETSISINNWIPIPEDNNERVQEAIVQLLMKQLVKDLNLYDQQSILNPNVEEEVSKISTYEMIDTIKLCKNFANDKENHKVSRNDFVNTILDKYDFIEKCHVLTREEFGNFLERQSKRFEESENSVLMEKDFKFDLINAIVHPEVINLIKSKLFEK